MSSIFPDGFFDSLFGKKKKDKSDTVDDFDPESALDTYPVFPMDFKYAVPNKNNDVFSIGRSTASDILYRRNEALRIKQKMLDIKRNIVGYSPEFDRLSKELEFLEAELEKNFDSHGNPSPANPSFTSGYSLSASYASTWSFTTPSVGKALSASWAPIPSGAMNWANFATTASYVITGNNPSFVSAISGKIGGVPDLLMDGFMRYTVNIGDLKNKATVNFKCEGLSKLVWLNDNVEVVKRGLNQFSVRVREASGAGNKPWFNCVCKGDGLVYQSKRLTFDGLLYDEHVIKVGLNHHVDIQGQDPMAVLREIKDSYKFFITCDMDIDDEENEILEFIVNELWAFNPQKQANELIFKV